MTAVQDVERPPARRRLAPPRLRRLPWWGWLVALLAAMLVLALLRVITGADDIDSSGQLRASLALAVPIGLAALGGLWAERAGVVNIGLEGMMILGTWGAGYAGYQWGPWAGVLFAILMGALGGLVHAVATVTFGVDHIVSGVALNILGPGVTKFLADLAFTGKPGGGSTQSPQVADLPDLSVPGLGSFLQTQEERGWFLYSDVAGLLRAVTTNVSVLTVIAVLLVVGTFFLLWRTAFGLRLRSCGENPYAAEALGVHVLRYKYVAVVVSGACAGLAGAFLAIVAASAYRDGQTGGRGFIGLAAMIFGNWRPGGLAAGAGVFGFTDALQLRGGGEEVRALFLPFGIALVLYGIWQLSRRHRVLGLTTLVLGVLALVVYLRVDAIAGDFTSMTPYVTTLLVLALFSQRLRMPAADGLVYRKGEGR